MNWNSKEDSSKKFQKNFNIRTYSLGDRSTTMMNRRGTNQKNIASSSSSKRAWKADKFSSDVFEQKYNHYRTKSNEKSFEFVGNFPPNESFYYPDPKFLDDLKLENKKHYQHVKPGQSTSSPKPDLKVKWFEEDVRDKYTVKNYDNPYWNPTTATNFSSETSDKNEKN